MKIALLTDGITPYVTGGIQRHSFYLAKYLAKKGVLVDLYHTSDPAIRAKCEALECFTEEEKRNIKSVYVEFPSSGSLPGHYIRNSFEYSARILKQFSREGVDFIYAKGFTGWKFIQEKDKGWKAPLIGVNFHGLEMYQRSPSLLYSLQARWLLRSPVKYNCTHADVVFSYGRGITSILKGVGVKEDRIIEVPAGIDESWLINDAVLHDRPRKILFAGRYERRKGVEELMKALSMIDPKLFEFHYLGECPEALSAGKAKIIKHGVVTEVTTIRQIMRSCDILICPSYSEGMPNVILEAMASGLAVIATDVGAVSEMISDKNGQLLSDNAPSFMATEIRKILELRDDELLALKRNSIKTIREKFLWSTIAEAVINSISLRLKA